MTYYGPPNVSGRTLGIKPTKADRDLVHAWSIMGISIREISRRLGEHYKLAKPMSRVTLYWHFRKELLHKSRGPHPSPGTIRRKVEANIISEVQKMINDMAKRGKRG